jgi:hypothetical protein
MVKNRATMSEPFRKTGARKRKFLFESTIVLNLSRAVFPSGHTMETCVNLNTQMRPVSEKSSMPRAKSAAFVWATNPAVKNIFKLSPERSLRRSSSSSVPNAFY